MYFSTVFNYMKDIANRRDDSYERQFSLPLSKSFLFHVSLGLPSCHQMSVTKMYTGLQNAYM